jgi:hypothetical protein
MERESFESSRIAALLNERFVPIKVRQYQHTLTHSHIYHPTMLNMHIPITSSSSSGCCVDIYQGNPSFSSFQSPFEQGGSGGAPRCRRRVHGLHPGGDRRGCVRRIYVCELV